jgi:hypothetical protein
MGHPKPPCTSAKASGGCAQCSCWLFRFEQCQSFRFISATLKDQVTCWSQKKHFVRKIKLVSRIKKSITKFDLKPQDVGFYKSLNTSAEI